VSKWTKLHSLTLVATSKCIFQEAAFSSCLNSRGSRATVWFGSSSRHVACRDEMLVRVPAY
jgi:hypothetical protein